MYVCMYMHELYTCSCIYIYIDIDIEIYIHFLIMVFLMSMLSRSSFGTWFDLVRSDFEVKSLRLTSKALNCLLQSWVVLHLLSTRA